MNLKINESINFRPITDNDISFLYNVYASTRQEEMALTGWSEQEKEEFLHMQFNLQHKQYLQNYKNASFEIIIYNKESSGRLYVDRRKDEIRIIDIALLPQFRNKGIGTKIMRDLLFEGKEKKLPVRLHVEHFNPALQFYERLGFKKIGDTGVYFFMGWSPSEKTDQI